MKKKTSYNKNAPIEEVILDTAVLLYEKKIKRDAAIDVCSALLEDERRRIEKESYIKAADAVSKLNNNEPTAKNVFGFSNQ